MRSTAVLSIVFGVVSTIGACAGSVLNPPAPASGKDAGPKPIPSGGAMRDSSRDGVAHCRDACVDVSSYADRCPTMSRTGTATGIGACPMGPLSFEKPRALLSATSFGPGVAFRALRQYEVVASGAGAAGARSFIVQFTMPPDPSVAVATTVLELPASDQARSIVALGPRASNPDDAHQFEALACGGSDCAFYVSSGGPLARDPELPTLPNDNYRHIECRRPGASCDLCIASPTARLCLAGNTFKPEGVAVPDVGICCPIAANETRWAVDADFRGLSRLALTQSGDLLNDFAATTTGGACCIQETGFTDAVGFDVIACGQASNPMILTGSTLFGTTSCAMSH